MQIKKTQKTQRRSPINASIKSVKASKLNKSKYSEAEKHIKAAIDILASSAKTDEVAKDSIANLGVVMLDLRGSTQIKASDDDDEWDIEDERPYTMTPGKGDMSKWDADCWAYYIAKKEKYDEDEYYDLLHDINNLRANEYIENEWFDKLSKKDIEAFKKFIKYNDDEDEE